MKRILAVMTLFGALIIGCEYRSETNTSPNRDRAKSKVEVNAPGVNVEVERKKN